MKYTIIILLVAFLVGGYLMVTYQSSEVTNQVSSGTTIVAVGDSLVAGVGATQGNDFVSVLSKRIAEPIVNLGRSGDTTEDVLLRMDEVLEQDPKVVLVLVGGNDYLKNIPRVETFANLEQIIQTIQDSGSAVLLLGVRGGILRDEYKSEFSALADKYNTGYVSNVLEDTLGRRELMSDLIHPNDAGYKIIADRVQPELELLLQ